MLYKIPRARARIIHIHVKVLQQHATPPLLLLCDDFVFVFVLLRVLLCVVYVVVY